MEEMCFDDLRPVEVPVSIGGKKYVLREASEDAAVQYRNAASGAARFEEGKVSRVEGIGSIQPLLVHLCLFETLEGKDGLVTYRNVLLQTVKSWPARVVRALYDRAREISRLEENETAESLEREIGKLTARLAKLREASAKNSAGGGTGTSASPPA